ncbi:MAG: glycosyltransferase family 4 protein [Anaerolineae bacterium]|nr:glycosyltransferase family 4 protein [Anaerolineae bacterium]
MKKGKIELLTLDFPPISGGISHYLYKIASHLPSDEIRIVGVATPESVDFDSWQSFEICRLKVPTKYSAFAKQLKFFAPFYLAKSIRHQDISYVLCGQAHYTIMLPAWAISCIKRVPFGVFAYGLDLLHPQGRAYKVFFNALIRSADILFVDSCAAQKIAEQLGVNPSRIHVVYPSVDPHDLQSDITAQEVKNRYSIANKKCILTVSRLIERKGHDMIVQALPFILQKVPDAHYLIVGSGPNEAELKRLVSDLRMENHVTFAGFVAQTELGAYFSACDVFTMISREIPEKGDVEGFGIVYLQASMFGKPIVAGRSGGVPEAVLDHETGLLVDPSDVKAITEALIRLLLDTDLAYSLGSEAKRRVLADFSSKLSAQKVIMALASIRTA